MSACKGWPPPLGDWRDAFRCGEACERRCVFYERSVRTRLERKAPGLATNGTRSYERNLASLRVRSVRTLVGAIPPGSGPKPRVTTRPSVTPGPTLGVPCVAGLVDKLKPSDVAMVWLYDFAWLLFLDLVKMTAGRHSMVFDRLLLRRRVEGAGCSQVYIYIYIESR